MTSAGPPIRMRAECPCGAVVEADDGEAIVELVRHHARTAHGRELDDGQVMAMVRPA